MLQTLKFILLPKHAVPCRILFGPFRGARVILNPQISLRYIFGVYERELNPWITEAAPRADRVFDVGANHGYFAFGIMAAWRRARKAGVVWAFEPEEAECQTMQRAAPWNESPGVKLSIERGFVADIENPTTLALDRFSKRRSIAPDQGCTLLKVDVEGFEMKVLQGAHHWVRPNNLFLIEAHSDSLLEEVSQFFRERKHAFQVIKPHPGKLVGAERRSLSTCWVVSDLSKG